MKTWQGWMLILLAGLALTLTACGGGGGGGVADTDKDGIPDTDDAAPNDPDTFALFGPARLLSNPAGGDFTAAVAINDKGTVVGLADSSTNITSGARWQVDATGAEAVAEILAALDADGYSASYAVNEAGATVGESASAVNIVPVIWPAAATAPVALPLLAGGGNNGCAYGITDGETIVGEAQTAAGNLVAVTWAGPGAAPVELTGLGGPASAAYFINDFGEIVGEAEDAGGMKRAVFWASGTAPAVELPMLSATDTAAVALGINDAGDIVGEVELADGSRKGILWRKDGSDGFTAADLGTSGAAASNDGTRIVGNDTGMAAIWDTRSLNIANHNPVSDRTSQAYAVNNNDVVVGVRNNTAFVAVPE